MVSVENPISRHIRAFWVQKFIKLVRTCTNSIIEVRSGFTKNLIETTVDNTRRCFGEIVGLIIQRIKRTFISHEAASLPFHHVERNTKTCSPAKLGKIG